MSKLKDIQITIDEARELIEKFGEEHQDVKLALNKSKVDMFLFDVTMRDKETHYGWGHMFDATMLCANGLSSLENQLNVFYDDIVKHRKELDK